MRLLVVDDEPMVLQDITEMLKLAVPGAEIASFTRPALALQHVQNKPVDVAFLDIELGGTDGLLLSMQLKDICPTLHIIFVTSHSQYAVDAFALHATGYLLKPVVAEDIRREMTFVYSRIPSPKTVRVQTFGGFCVFVNNQMLKFGRSKAKELLALLIDRRGGDVTTREACAVLWEDAPYNNAQKNYFHQVLRDLRRTLHEAGVERILIHSRNSLAIDPEQLDCDLYRFMKGEPQAVNCYRRDYMPSYSWAELTLGQLERPPHALCW